jgi:hypothetical protein
MKRLLLALLLCHLGSVSWAAGTVSVAPANTVQCTGSVAGAPGNCTSLADPVGALGFENVQTFGADPTGVADSATAFTNAVAALPSGGGTVFIPKGTYELASGFVITRSNVKLLGQGINASTVRCALSVSVCIQFGSSSITASNNSVEHLTITRDTGTPPTSSIGLSWGNFNYGHESDVLVTNNYYDRARMRLREADSTRSVIAASTFWLTTPLRLTPTR